MEERNIALSYVFELPPRAQIIEKWYESSRIEYVLYFLKLYIAYNAWYQEVTHTSNDRQALTLLKKRFVIWEHYSQGKTMKLLKSYMNMLADLTQKEPLIHHGSYWDGEITNNTDWRSLIEYWYQVRCLIVHGAEVPEKYVWLAYETLTIFMNEIIDRMKRRMYQKGGNEVEVWNVDMQADL